MNHVLGEVPEWVPVRIGEVGPFRCAEEVLAYREDVERARAPRRGCRRCAGPSRSRPTASGRCSWRPTRSRSAARVAFSLAAFRQAFAGGRDLSERDNVLLAAAACEMHPAAVIKGAELRGTRERLLAADGGGRRGGSARDAGDRDRRRHGVIEVPA